MQENKGKESDRLLDVVLLDPIVERRILAADLANLQLKNFSNIYDN